MVRKFTYNKIFRTTGMLFLLVLLLLFPASKKYSLNDVKVKQTFNEAKKQEAFLLDKDGYVARCKISFEYVNSEEKARKLVELMIIDGKYEEKIPNGFEAILPTDTKLNSLVIDKENVVVDLSKEFYDLSMENELKAVQMLTYNLTSIDEIKNVYVNIDGKKLDYLPKNKLNIAQPFKRSDGINYENDLISYKNITKTTIYYVSKSNNGYYYVPVTKITNDASDKIKIIVNELTSSHIYETNLMSFLNYNTKLQNYTLNDKVLTLDFNKYLFDDANTSNILEEVIYSICLSVRDNYDVNEVVFTVDGKEITKSVIKNIE